MPANVCAPVAAKVRAWTFLLLPGCTMPNATGALVHYWGFYMWSLSPEQTVKVRQSPSYRTGAIRWLCKDNVPVSSQECSCWVRIYAVERPSWFVFHSLECKLHHWIAFTTCSLTKDFCLRISPDALLTVVKLHWHFSGRISPSWTSNQDFLRKKAVILGRTRPPPLISNKMCTSWALAAISLLVHTPKMLQPIPMWIIGVTSLTAAAAHHLCLEECGCEYPHILSTVHLMPSAGG